MQYGPSDACSDERAQHLAAIIEHANTAVISHTLDGTITSWNSAAERTFGYKAAEMLGKSSWVLVPAAGSTTNIGSCNA